MVPDFIDIPDAYEIFLFVSTKRVSSSSFVFFGDVLPCKLKGNTSRRSLTIGGSYA